MTKTRYAKNSHEKKQSGRALIRDADISTKVSVEIANHLRGKNVNRAITILQNVIDMKEPIPYKRFNRGVGHRKGVGSARYPIKASKIIMQLLKDAKANAQNKGLSDELIIAHIVPNKASEPYHYGRQRGTKTKRTHVEVILTEKKEDTKKEQKKSKGDNN